MTDVIHLQGWPGKGDPPTRVQRAPVPALDRSSRLILVAAADAESTTEERFGLGAWVHLDGASTVAAGIVVPDGHPRHGELVTWARSQHVARGPLGEQPWRAETLIEFLHAPRRKGDTPGRFFKLTYRRAGFLVGADLGRLLGLLCEKDRWRAGRGSWAGGFTIWPVGWSEWFTDKAGRRKLGSVSPHVPAIRVLARTGTWNRVAYARPPGGHKPDERNPGGRSFGKRNPDTSHFEGLFFDVCSAAYPLDGVESSDLADHAEAFGLPRVSMPAALPVDPGGAEVLAAVLGVVRDLSELLDAEGRKWLTTHREREEREGRIDLRFTASPGGVASKIDARSGAAPMLWLPGAPDDGELTRWMAAHHGGWLSCELAGAGLFPAADIDIRSGYPACYRLLGFHELRRAERFEREDVTAELRVLLADLAAGNVEALFDPVTWRRFGATICEGRPDGETFPVQAPDADFPDGHAAMRPVTSSVCLPFAWPDFARSALDAGRAPALTQATRLVPVGRQGRDRFPLYDGRWVRQGEDAVLALVRLRDEAKRDGDGRAAAQDRVVANSLSYGDEAEVDQRTERIGPEPAEGERDRRRTGLVERPSRGTFPPIAASVTAACRLAVGVAEHLWCGAGGTVASRDTDGLLLVCSPTGSKVTLDDGRVVEALSWATLDEVLRRFDGLAEGGIGAPFFKPALREHDGRPLHGVVLRVKRHAIGTLDDDGDLCELVKASEHGLGGQVVDPPGMAGRGPDRQHLWTREVAAEALRQAIARRRGEDRGAPGRWPWDAPGAESFPLLERAQAATPAAVADVAERFGLSVRPFGLYVTAGRPAYGIGTLRPLGALDPGGDLAGWGDLAWRTQGHARVSVTTDGTKAPRSAVLRSVEDKALDWMVPRALPVRPVTIDDERAIRWVGRGGRLIEARAAGDTETPAETLRVDYSDLASLSALVAELAHTMGPTAFSQAFGVPIYTAEGWSAGARRPSAASVRELLPRLRLAVPGTCALDGCEHPVEGRRTYCSCSDHPPHRWAAQKRRQRAAKSLAPGEPGADERKETGP